jgi:hypothetical protein
MLENVTVEALRLDEADLNTKRMLELMAFDKTQPLYVQVVQRILREMRLSQQRDGGAFNYSEFTQKLLSQQLNPDQKRGLQQRLDTLESFMVPEQVDPFTKWKVDVEKRSGTNWTPKVSSRCHFILLNRPHLH